MAISASPHDAHRAEQMFVTAAAQVRRFEARWSRFLPTSEVARLSERPGVWLDVSSDTLSVLRLAIEAHRETEGLFNPTLGHLLHQYGYDRSFDLGLDSTEAVPSSPGSFEQVPIEMDEAQQRVRLTAPVALDLGGIAKGWIANRMVGLFQEAGFPCSACSAGGDMMCAGLAEGRPWRIQIVHPLAERDDEPIAIELVGEALATSGVYRRRWQRGDDTLHHLLDPRTGLPAATDILSCSVVMPNLVQAEVYAKAALLLGFTQGDTWLREHGCDRFVMIRDDGEVMRSWKS